MNRFLCADQWFSAPARGGPGREFESLRAHCYFPFNLTSWSH